MTVVDAGSRLDERTLTIFEHADRLIVPVIPEIPAMRAVRTLLEVLGELEGPSKGIIVVLNHVFPRDMLRRDEIEGALGAPIDLELPYDPGLYLAAANAGEPIVSGAPRSAPAERLNALAGLLLGERPPDAASLRGSDARQRLASLLRRG